MFGGRAKTRRRYPESLIVTAIERAVDGTDSRLRLVPGYHKRLRAPVIHAIEHVAALVDAIPAPLMVRRHAYSDEPRLAAVFASAEDMLDCLGRGASLMDACASPTHPAWVTALLLAERVDKNILGMDLLDGRVQREVAQVAVSFTGHRLLNPTTSEQKTRRQLKRRAFDHLLTLASTRLTEVRLERTDLVRQRDRLRRQLNTLERGSWRGGQAAGTHPAPAALLAELKAISRQLDDLGVDDGVLRANLILVAALLGEAERQLWCEHITLHLDPMNIQRDRQDPSARPIVLHELHNARGRRVIPLLISFAPGELPPREDSTSAVPSGLTSS
jgi:hypothetical protein